MASSDPSVLHPVDPSALIERAKGGDVRAFEALVRAELPRIRRFARSMCRNEADADDLAQDALLKAYVSIASYRFQAAFSTWLFRIVRNTLVDSTRSAAGKRAQQTDPLESTGVIATDASSGSDEQLLRAELRTALWSALRALPLEFRTAVVLFEVEGMTLEEIAAIEEVAVGTVKSRLSRGRGQLRSLLVARGVVERGNPAGSDLVESKSTTR